MLQKILPKKFLEFLLASCGWPCKKKPLVGRRLCKKKPLVGRSGTQVWAFGPALLRFD